jgi:pimeloyl-ACP methyl ester carboxylesterase
MQGFKISPRGSLQSLSIPALVICGDRDVVRVEHAVEQFRLIAGSQLAILPGTGHMNVTARSEWLVPMINQFLDEA